MSGESFVRKDGSDIETIPDHVTPCFGEDLSQITKHCDGRTGGRKWASALEEGREEEEEEKRGIAVKKKNFRNH